MSIDANLGPGCPHGIRYLTSSTLNPLLQLSIAKPMQCIHRVLFCWPPVINTSLHGVTTAPGHMIRLEAAGYQERPTVMFLWVLVIMKQKKKEEGNGPKWCAEEAYENKDLQSPFWAPSEGNMGECSFILLL